MEKYCVNKETKDNPKGNHEVHKKGCHKWPENGEDLGEFADCHGAVQKAKDLGYSKVDGCVHCCPDCHNE
ncbi:hypothetical protein KAR91_62390 [Candidatus Pacearchaeota archaeon]|nr:hypothetical protein [Candidatus Pacearchaeota archaeon]